MQTDRLKFSLDAFTFVFMILLHAGCPTAELQTSINYNTFELGMLIQNNRTDCQNYVLVTEPGMPVNTSLCF